ncbi:BAG family molecular chaperone regulator 8, chloroplastic-like [Dorcoceras hygrometricum]|uniref:BAG family molecular chaperone regulator 8, chloroplastic-like n=1 Tax=Dorcoceras hygrometricum TaxID=472368 RepID=A0A2Z7B589_9LAMI|nr:BAG family molecular chaperone regulator 8, chloroplastic-like [Dorcoceras hygrometricum]
MKCMRAIKDRIARPANRLANHLKRASIPRTAKSADGNHQSVPGPVSPLQLGGRHSNPAVTTPMIALDFSGTTHLSASHNVALNQVINQSVNKAQDVCMYAIQKSMLNAYKSQYRDLKFSNQISPKSKILKFENSKILNLNFSILTVEPSKIKFGLGIEIRGVEDGDLYKASFPKSFADDKGKNPLEEPNTIKGHPARESFKLICGDIDFLVQLRDKVLDEISSFFLSFILRKLVVLESVKAIAAKEEQVLTWEETDSVQIALQRRLYIVAKYREMLLRKFLEAHRQNFRSGKPSTSIDLQIIDLLSNSHQISLEKLLKQKRAHGLEWQRPCCAKLFEGEHVDCGAIIDRSNTNTRSICWSRHMIKINGLWTPIWGPDWWYCMCHPSYYRKKQLVSQRVFVSSLAPICVFIEPSQDLGFPPPMVKTWGWFRVCTDILEFSLFGRLDPVGTTNLLG